MKENSRWASQKMKRWKKGSVNLDTNEWKLSNLTKIKEEISEEQRQKRPKKVKGKGIAG